MEKGGEKQEEDFDIYQMITESKKLRFELDRLKEKTNLVDDPMFNQVNQKTIINLEEGDGDEVDEKKEGDVAYAQAPKVNPSINSENKPGNDVV